MDWPVVHALRGKAVSLVFKLCLQRIPSNSTYT